MPDPFEPPRIGDPAAIEAWRADPEAFLVRCRAEHGDVFTLELDPPLTYVLDPHAFGQLLMSKQVDFSPVSQQSKRRFGLGRIVESEAQVRALSSDFVRALRGASLRGTIVRADASLAHACAEVAAQLDTERFTTLEALADQTLVRASVEALYGEAVWDEGTAEDVQRFSRAVASRLKGQDSDLDPAGREAEARLLSRLVSVVDEGDTPVLASLRDGVLGRPDLDDEERARTLLMLLWGSLINLRPTSVWMYGSVIGDAQLVDRLRREGVGQDGPLTRSVVDESMRLFSRPNMYRQVVETFDLPLQGGRSARLHAGSWVALFPRLLHHDPEVFDEPQAFDPDRFLSGEGFAKGGAELRHPLMIFGVGRGRCPGDGYAREVLARALDHWTSTFHATLEVPTLPRAVTRTVASTPEAAEPVAVRLRAR